MLLLLSYVHYSYLVPNSHPAIAFLSTRSIPISKGKDLELPAYSADHLTVLKNPQTLILVGYIAISSRINQNILGLGCQNPHWLGPVTLSRKRREKIPYFDREPGIGDVKNPKTRGEIC